MNVVTMAAFINGRRLGDERDRLVEACERGGSSLFGTGVSRGVPALNAIPSVVAAPPGIVSYPDLGFPLPRGWVRSP